MICKINSSVPYKNKEDTWSIISTAKSCFSKLCSFVYKIFEYIAAYFTGTPCQNAKANERLDTKPVNLDPVQIDIKPETDSEDEIQECENDLSDLSHSVTTEEETIPAADKNNHRINNRVHMISRLAPILEVDQEDNESEESDNKILNEPSKVTIAEQVSLLEVNALVDSADSNGGFVRVELAPDATEVDASASSTTVTQRCAGYVKSMLGAVASKFRSGNDEKNQQKYKLTLQGLLSQKLPEDEMFLSLKEYLNCNNDYRDAYHALLKEIRRLLRTYPGNIDVKNFCKKLWNGLDLAELYVSDVKAILREMGQKDPLNGFDDLRKINLAFDKYLKSSTSGKSSSALGKQKLWGALRSMDWPSINIPSMREEQIFHGLDENVAIRYVRHPNAVFKEGNKEILDPSFSAMLDIMKKEKTFVFYTSFLKNKECGAGWENEFVGNMALKEGERRHKNLHVLFQSVQAPLFLEDSGDFHQLKKKLLDSFASSGGDSGEYFVLPSILKVYKSGVKPLDQYMHEIEEIANNLHHALFDKKENLTNEEWRAFCLVFFALQRDHLKMKLQQISGFKCGHYTTPCKDFLDRGGVNAFVERMVHEVILGTFITNRKNWLLEEMFSLLGATWATKKIGVIDERLALAETVYNIFSNKPDCLRGYTFKCGEKEVRIDSVHSNVRGFLH